MPRYDNEHDTGFPDRAKEWIDGKVYGGLEKAGRGGLAVLGSGFGKGLLIAAGAITVGILGAAIIAPAAIGLSTTLGAAGALNAGLAVAGNTLLSGGGLLALAGAGAVGSLVAAHSDKTRISVEAAQAQAQAHAQARVAGGEDPEQCAGMAGGFSPNLPPHLRQAEGGRGMAS